MNFTPKLALVALAVSVTFGLGACSKQEPEQEAKKEPAKDAPPQEIVVKIGHAAPLTVKTPHLGKDNENGANLAIDEANAKGLSIDGKKIKFALVSEDDQGDPKVGTTVAQKLVDAKVAGIVGHLNSGVSIPASRIYNDAGIPMISGSSTNPDLTEQKFKVTFRVVGRDDQQGPAIANYLVSEFKPKTVAIIDDASAYGKGLANEVEKTLVQAGVKVLPREQGTDTSTDFKPILTKIRGRKPDAVFYGGMDQTGGLLLKQGRELGIKAVFAFGDGACTEEMKKLAGEKQAEGFVCSQAGIPVQAASKAFLDGYKAKFNVDPILYSPFTYDATNLLIAAMQKANSVDPAKYLSALAGISFQGASGRIEFDEKGDRKDAEMTIFTMKGGKLEPVAIVKGGTTTKFEEFMKAASAAGSAAKEAGKEALDKAGDAAAAGAAATKDAAGRAFDTAKDVAGKAVDATKETAKEVAKDVSQGVKQMGEDAKTAGKQISDTAGKAVEGAKDLVRK